MKIRLLLSFISVSLISIVSVVFIFNQQTATEVSNFIRRGVGWDGQANIEVLENYYRTNRNWQGVEVILSTRNRRMGQMPFNGMGEGKSEGILGVRLRLADSTGEVLIDTRNPSPQERLSDVEIEAAVPLHLDEEIVGYLHSEFTPEFQNRNMRPLFERLNHAALIAGVVAVSLSIILALVLSYGLLYPINALIKAASQMGGGDLNQRVSVKGWGELDKLSLTFNLMAESLQLAEERRRHQTADIAHELRTPLAVQRAQLEAMLDGIYDFSTENIQSVLAQNRLLTRLVEDLRILTLADSGELYLERVEADFIALVRRVVNQFMPQAEARKISISIIGGESCPHPKIDTDRIAQVLGNLLSNALRYTPEGGQIRLICSHSYKDITLMVHDSGIGIAPEALPHIFERFYRGDRSRSRSEGGSGLGLTIARKIIRAHGGDLTAQKHAEGGALFTLFLPLEQYES